MATTATIPIDTSVTATRKKLLSHIDGKPAPKHDGKNVMIDIFVKPDEAIFYCQFQEHVGKHTHRHVRFHANADCELHFTDPAVFGILFTTLEKGVPKNLEVADESDGVETGYYVVKDKGQSSDTQLLPTEYGLMKPVPHTMGDPKIVVP